MKITRLLNHMTFNQLRFYHKITNNIIECNDGTFEEVLWSVKDE